MDPNTEGVIIEMDAFCYSTNNSSTSNLSSRQHSRQMHYPVNAEFIIPVLETGPDEQERLLETGENTRSGMGGTTVPHQLAARADGSFGATGKKALPEDGKRIFHRNPFSDDDDDDDDVGSGKVYRAEKADPEQTSDSDTMELKLPEVVTCDDSVLAHGSDSGSMMSADDFAEADGRVACLQVNSLIVFSLSFCFAVVTVGLLSFLPFYFLAMESSTTTIDIVLDAAMRGVHAITVDSLTILPDFVNIITYNYLLSDETTQNETKLPDTPGPLLKQFLAVASRFDESISFMRFIYENGLFVSTTKGLTPTTVSAGSSTTPVRTPRYEFYRGNLSQVTPPIVSGYSSYDAYLVNSGGFMQQVVVPWSQGVNRSIRWTFEQSLHQSNYFNYVVPFRVDEYLGYCAAGMPSAIIMKEAFGLLPSLHEHGRIAIFDDRNDIVVINSWGQAYYREEEDKTGSNESFRTPLKIADVDDHVMGSALVEVGKRGGIRAVMGDQTSVKIDFPLGKYVGQLVLARIKNEQGMNIVLAVTVLHHDFEKPFATARKVVIPCTVGLLLLAVVASLVISYQIQKPLKRLAADLNRASTLDVTNGRAQSSSTLSTITEVRQTQVAYDAMLAGIREMRSYVPQAMMTNVSASGSCYTDDARLNSPTKPQRTQLNRGIFKEKVNEFKSTACTVVLIEFHRSMDPAIVYNLMEFFSLCVKAHSGCVDHLSHDRLLISFGAHTTLPMQAMKGAQFACAMYNGLSEELRRCVVVLVDYNEFYVGTCGANKRNYRVTYGIRHLLDMTRVLWDIGCHVAATHQLISHMSGSDAMPIECVLLQGTKVPIVLYELRLASLSAAASADTPAAGYARHFLNGFWSMRKGLYEEALRCFGKVPDSLGPQLFRLQAICQERISACDSSAYVRPIEAPFQFEYRELVQTTPAEPAAVKNVADEDDDDGEGNGVASSSSTTAPSTPRGGAKVGVDSAPLVDLDLQDEAAFLNSIRSAQTMTDVMRRSAGSAGGEPLSEDNPFNMFIHEMSATSNPSSSTGGLQADMPITFADANGMEWTRSSMQIGEGTFSIVYLGISTAGRQAAIKCIPRLRRCSSEENLEQEIHISSTLRHANIVQYISYYASRSQFAIVMEYVPGNSLYAVLETFGALSKSAARRFMVDILCGLAYLHSENIVHCDMKPHNVLLSSEGVCKLADFGSAISDMVMMGNSTHNGAMVIGTALYMAPEVARGERGSPQSDIFSVGMTLLHMMLGRPAWKWSANATSELYPDMDIVRLMRNDSTFIRALSRGDVEPDIPDSLDADVIKFARSCCHPQPMRRQSAEELLSSPFLL